MTGYRTRALPLRYWLPVAGLLLVSSCQTGGPQPQSLQGPHLAKLQKLSRPPSQLNVTLGMNDAGVVTVTGSGPITGPPFSRVYLYTPRNRPPRFPLARVLLNGYASLALVDTGSSVTVLDYWGATRMGVNPIGPDFIRTAVMTPGGTAAQILGVARSLELGDIRFETVPVGILDDARKSTGHLWMDGFRIETILGGNVLGALAYYTVNLPREKFIACTRGAYQPDPERLVGEAALITRYGIPALHAMVGGAGPVVLGLDTGGDFGLWLPRPVAASLNLPELAPGGDIRLGQSVKNRTVYKPAPPRDIDLVGFSITNLPVLVGMVNMGVNDPPYGLLGSELFHRYAITIDNRARRIYFERPE